MNTEYWLKVCKEAGDEVFKEINKIIKSDDKRKILKTGFSGDNTLDVDDLAESIILKNFKSTGKSFKFISEEIGITQIGNKSEVVIAVDPLDGSNNMSFGLSVASSSIAIGDLSEKIGGIKVGYVKDLFLGNEYYAIEGKGAFKNDKKISVTKERKGCILVDIAKDRNRNFQRIVPFGDNFRSVRMTGSSTLQMCQFAEGAADAHVILGGVRTLDYAASQLITKEAGGIIKDLDGKAFNDYDIGFNMKVNLIATFNESMYKMIRELLGD